MRADLVLLDGNVLTMNPAQPRAEAIAIEKDRIVKVGTNKEINQWIGKTTRVIELEKRTVVPGFIDTHVHVADFGKFLRWIDLKEVTSIKEMQRRIKKRAEETPDGKWILGQGWDQTHFKEKRIPNSQDLDKASPHNPVILYHLRGRICVVNSKALKLARITQETKAPSGGTIEKDAETGEPIGVLHDAATDLVWKIIPEPSEEEIIEVAGLACGKIVEAGITSIHWIVSSSTEIQIIQKLRAENKLPLRVYVIIPVDILDHVTDFNLHIDSGDIAVRVGGVKIFADGSLAAQTAALNEPYSNNQAIKGELMYTQEELNALVAKAHKTNLRIVIHAMGDQAIEMALTALEKTLREVPRRNHRYRLEHAAVLNKGLIQRIKRLEVMVAMQPRSITSEFSVWSAVNRLGSARARWLYPLKTLFKEGITVSGGSDCPMELISPFSGIYAAVARRVFPEEQITVDEALRMYTVNAAYASSEENLKGTIETGKLADITVISRDPITTPPNKIEDIKVRMTIIGGKVVYPRYVHAK